VLYACHLASRQSCMIFLHFFNFLMELGGTYDMKIYKKVVVVQTSLFHHLP
jgi:hypothetical protein